MKDLKMDIPLSELYQEVILDHNRNPRNFRKLEKPNRYSHGYNPLCGDDYEVFLSVGGERLINDASFLGSGCAISKASSSMMTSMVKGKKVDEAQGLARSFIDLITKDHGAEDSRPEFKRLKVFEGVRKFPIRVKCATLVWHALEDALKQDARARARGEGS